MPRYQRKIIDTRFHEARQRMYDSITYKQQGRNLTSPRQAERQALDNAAYGAIASSEPSKEELIDALVESGKWNYCNSCMKAYPYTPEYFRRSHRARTGLQNMCVECNRDLARRNMARIRARRKAAQSGE